MVKIHPATPAIMVGFLLAGIAFALGHHFFYNSLDRHPIEDLSYNLSYLTSIAPISDQAINIAIGTALAFLVKTCLVNAVGMAFTQVIWKIARSQTTRISTLDSMFSLTGNILQLFHGRLWFYHPILMLLALLTWLLPLAALVSPGTLTVSHEKHDSNLTKVVPLVDFTKLSFANLPGWTADGPENYENSSARYTYQGPRDPVDQIVTGTFASGLISLMTPPTINSSWELSFPGPALRCDILNGAEKTAVVDNIWQESTKEGFEGSSCGQSYAYVSWRPSQHQLGNLPFQGNTVPTEAGRNFGSNDPDSIYVAVTNQLLHSFKHQKGATCENSSTIGTIDVHKPPIQVVEDALIVRCQLWNRSYHANFTYENGAQTVGISLGQYYNNITSISSVNSIPSDLEEDPDPKSHVYINGRSLSFDTPETVDKINPMATLAYQSLMDSFAKTLVGRIYNEDHLTTANTTIMSTSLSNQPELAFLREYDWETPHQTLADTDRSRAYVNTTATSNLNLAQALEQVFQNITLSLFSAEEFRYNTSLPDAPGPVEVQTWNDRNIYVYERRTLWISYGIALAFSAVGVVVGLIVMSATGAAFSSNFSTYLRTIRMARLSLDIHSSDLDGADPLPKYLAKAQVVFAKGMERKDTDKENEQT